MLVNDADYMWSFASPQTFNISEPEQEISFVSALKIYRIKGSGTITIYENRTKENSIYSGSLPYEPLTPISCDGFFVVLPSENAGSDEQSSPAESASDEETAEVLMQLELIAESGIRKTVLAEYCDTTEGMEVVHSGYNDDGTFSTSGLSDFLFNNVAAETIYISSNSWVGFGTGSEQLKILRRDGCSMMIYRQLIALETGTVLKIRFDGYTVYHDRTEPNRLIWELFLLSKGDMFLNVIQTPTSSNTGTSAVVINGTTTELTLSDGSGGGTHASFYRADETGSSWDIHYSMYEEDSEYTTKYLIKASGTYYTVVDDALVALDITNLTASAFMEYGFDSPPAETLVLPLADPEYYSWNSKDTAQLIQAALTAYPYPQEIYAVADMSHVTITGIDLMTANYSGDVRVKYSVDSEATYTGEIALDAFLNLDLDELYQSLDESMRLYMKFVLHDNATITAFKITYKNLEE